MKKNIIVILCIFFFLVVTTWSASVLSESGSFDLEVEVLADAPVGGTINATNNGSFNLQVDVLNTGSGSLVNSTSFGSFRLKVYLEYFEWGNWSDAWEMHYASLPEVSSFNVANASASVPVNKVWECKIENPDGNTFNWSMECNNGQSASSDYGVNGTKKLNLSGLNVDTTYTVWVNATSTLNNALNNDSWYYFDTTHGLDVTNPVPSNNSVNVSYSQYNLSIDITDPEGGAFNWSIETSPDIGSNNSNTDTNGSKECVISGNLSYETSYTWFVNATDGSVTVNNTYYFICENLSSVSNMVVKNWNSTAINISWSKTVNITSSYVRYKKGSAPSSITDGRFLVNTTNTSYNHSGLDYGTHYYYGIWSYNLSSDIFSYGFSLGDNYTNPGSPSSLQDTDSSMISIDFTWDKGVNATRSVVFMNITGDANYPDRFTGVEKINTTGNTGTANGLIDNETYWFSVYSFNPDSGNWSESNSTDNASTLASAGGVSGLTATRFNDVQLNLSWSKANAGDDVVVLRKTGSYPASPTDGTVVYNGSLLSYKDSGLSPATKYFYKAWSWNGFEHSVGSSSTTGITRPSPPENFTGDIDSGNLIITWDKPSSASRTLIRNNTGVYPSLTNGYFVYNDTGESTTVAGISSIDYYRGWSYKVVDGEGIFSLPQNLLWGGLEVNVYKEDEPWIGIGNYTVFITNSDATESYQNTSGVNPFRIDVSDVPNGNDITVQISKQGYKTRTQVIDLFENTYYTIVFYLPASSEGSPSGESGEDWYVPPIEDETDMQTATEAVVDYTTDETVITSCVIGDIHAVYVYNDSVYGGWREIGTDNYSYTGHTITVDSSVLDVNSSVIKVEYYCGYSEKYSEHYILQVIDERQQTVGDAKITISRYINTTDDYETMYIIRTDSNGQQSVDLIPDIIYHIVIIHDDYDTDTSDWSPPVVEYEADISKVFVLEFPDVTPSQPDNPVEKISVSVIMSGSSIWVNYTDETSLTSNMYITVYETNNSDLSYGLWNSYSYNPASSFGSFSYEFTNANSSNFYNIYLMYNHSYYGYSPVTLGFSVGAENQNRSGTIDDTITSLFGWNPFGWHNFIMWILLIVGFMYIDERDSGVFLIIMGGIILFINFIVGFNTAIVYVAGGIIPFLFILFGIISMWNKKGRKY